MRAVNERIDNLPLLQIGGNENIRLQTSRGRIRRDRVRKITRRGARHRGETHFARAAQRHTHNAILERQRRIIHCVILDPQFANAQTAREAICFHQRRKTNLEANRGLMGDR
jgi:hypothetical protein